MRIERSINKDGTLAPSAVNFLGQISSQHQFVHERARRPPLALYNVSIAQLLKDFTAVLDEYDKTASLISTNGDKLAGGDYYAPLLQAQQSLIYSMQAHIDDCYSILASLVDPSTAPPNAAKQRFTERWLHAVSYPSLTQFRQDVFNLRKERLGPLVNGLKHRQNRLRGLFFYSSTEVRLGYYLEEPDATGVVGPSAAVHEDSNSGFSFAKDLRLAAFRIYMLSEALVTAVQAALKTYHGISLQPSPVEKNGLEGYSQWSELMRRVSDIKPLVFPDEIDKPYPYFSLISDHDDTSLVMMYPVTLIPLSFPQGMRITGIFIGDGVSKTFKIPYVKETKYGGVRQPKSLIHRI